LDLQVLRYNTTHSTPDSATEFLNGRVCNI